MTFKSKSVCPSLALNISLTKWFTDLMCLGPIPYFFAGFLIFFIFMQKKLLRPISMRFLACLSFLSPFFLLSFPCYHIPFFFQNNHAFGERQRWLCSRCFVVWNNGKCGSVATIYDSKTDRQLALQVFQTTVCLVFLPLFPSSSFTDLGWLIPHRSQDGADFVAPSHALQADCVACGCHFHTSSLFN